MPNLQQTRSREFAHQFAREALTKLNVNRYPLQRFEKGRWLNISDQRLNALPFIESGRLDAVLNVGEEGTQVIPVIFSRGEIALLSALFSEEPIPGKLVAAEPLLVRWIPLADLEAALLEDPGLLLILVKFLALRLREVRARERGWLERGVHERVCAGMARVALESPPASPDGPWSIFSTHEHLASRCGVSRPKLSQELKYLEHKGVVRLNRGRVDILDFSSLTSSF